MILNFRFISAISSCDSTRFLEYRLRSVRTASYSCFCCASFALMSARFFFSSEILLSRFFSSSCACMYLLFAAEHSTPYFSLALSRSYTFLTDSCSSCFTSVTCCSNIWLFCSCWVTTSFWVFVFWSVPMTPRLMPSLSCNSVPIVFWSWTTCFRRTSISRIRFSVSALRTLRCASTSRRSSSSMSFFLLSCSRAFCALSFSMVTSLVASEVCLICALISSFSSNKTCLFASSSLFESFIPDSAISAFSLSCFSWTALNR
mmetsp:Transcript_9766/g.25998  ORF Transcript_9766/g.25998 Transcript_9766/m.25998 type:complete len:260 (-) Transcript_9766:878-1657(-)